MRNQWEQQATGLLKAEITRRGLTYKALSDALASIGIKKTVNNLSRTITAGKFSFSFIYNVRKRCILMNCIFA